MFMNPFELPTSLLVGDVEHPIRTDYRDILYILSIFSDPDYESDERGVICLRVMFPDWRQIPPEQYRAALEAASAFIDGPLPPDSGGHEHGKRPRVMDWQQDAGLIIPAVNRVVGTEVRALEYMHWWTFLGAYMEIGDCLYSTVLSIRQKRAKGKKLETYEQAFYKANRALVDLRKQQTEQDAQRKEALKKLFV